MLVLIRGKLKVTVTRLYGGEIETFIGEPEEVRNQLLLAFSYLKRYHNETLQQDLDSLNKQQALIVSVE